MLPGLYEARQESEEMQGWAQKSVALVHYSRNRIFREVQGAKRRR